MFENFMTNFLNVLKREKREEFKNLWEEREN